MRNWGEVKCCFCGKPLWNRHHIELNDEMKAKYFGNNPYPVNTDENARCCDDCNCDIVIPKRLEIMFHKHEVH